MNKIKCFLQIVLMWFVRLDYYKYLSNLFLVFEILLVTMLHALWNFVLNFSSKACATHLKTETLNLDVVRKNHKQT